MLQKNMRKARAALAGRGESGKKRNDGGFCGYTLRSAPRARSTSLRARSTGTTVAASASDATSYDSVSVGVRNSAPPR